MQVSVEECGVIERRLTVSVPHGEIGKEIEKRLKDVAKSARIHGFRPGKVPQDMINKRYGAQITNEVISDTINSSYREALGKEEIVPAGLLSIEPKPFVAGDDLQYVATIELYPEIPAPTLIGRSIEKPVCEITAEDVERTLQEIRVRNATFTTKKGKSEKGDRLTIDFDGTIEGKPFAGSVAQNQHFVLDQKPAPKKPAQKPSVHEQFERGLLVLAAGDSKKIKVVFPDDYPSEASGKTAEFAVTVKSVEQPVLAELDDAFATQLGIQEGGMKKMREEIKINLQRELATRERAVLRNRILDELLKANPITAPKSLVESEIDRRVKSVQERMAAPQNSPTAKVEKGKLPAVARESFAEEARRQVLLGLIVREIVKKHNIVVDRDVVRARIEEIANSYDDSEAMAKWYYAEPSRLQPIEAMVLEEQVVTCMTDTATVTEKKVSFQEFMTL